MPHRPTVTPEMFAALLARLPRLAPMPVLSPDHQPNEAGYPVHDMHSMQVSEFHFELDEMVVMN